MTLVKIKNKNRVDKWHKRWGEEPFSNDAENVADEENNYKNLHKINNYTQFTVRAIKDFPGEVEDSTEVRNIKLTDVEKETTWTMDRYLTVDEQYDVSDSGGWY